MCKHLSKWSTNRMVSRILKHFPVLQFYLHKVAFNTITWFMCDFIQYLLFHKIFTGRNKSGTVEWMREELVYKYLRWRLVDGQRGARERIKSIIEGHWMRGRDLWTFRNSCTAIHSGTDVVARCKYLSDAVARSNLNAKL